jgi:hypothetical protein
MGNVLALLLLEGSSSCLFCPVRLLRRPLLLVLP